MKKWILHAYFVGLMAAGEQPSPRPSIVQQNDRVIDMCKRAKEAGVWVGMPVRKALRLAPDASLQEYDSLVHKKRSEQILQTLWKQTPWIESVGVAEWFAAIPSSNPVVEAKHLFREMAKHLPQEGWYVTAGIAANMLAAKMATLLLYEQGNMRFFEQSKIPIEGGAFLYVPDEASFVPQLPIRYLWKLPAKTRGELRKWGVRQIFELRHIPSSQLVKRFGKEASLWTLYASGEDNARLVPNYPPMQRTVEWKAEDGWISGNQLDSVFMWCTQQLADRLSKEGAGCQELVLEIVPEEGTPLVVSRPSSQLLHRNESLLFALKQMMMTVKMPVFVSEVRVSTGEVRPLGTEQLSFVIGDDGFLPIHTPPDSAIEPVLEKLSQRYPRHPVVKGAHVPKREMRLTWFDRTRTAQG